MENAFVVFFFGIKFLLSSEVHRQHVHLVVNCEVQRVITRLFSLPELWSLVLCGLFLEGEVGAHYTRLAVKKGFRHPAALCYASALFVVIRKETFRTVFRLLFLNRVIPWLWAFRIDLVKHLLV